MPYFGVTCGEPSGAFPCAQENVRPIIAAEDATIIFNDAEVAKLANNAKVPPGTAHFIITTDGAAGSACANHNREALARYRLLPDLSETAHLLCHHHIGTQAFDFRDGIPQDCGGIEWLIRADNECLPCSHDIDPLS
jgi:hypothetical protein